MVGQRSRVRGALCPAFPLRRIFRKAQERPGSGQGGPGPEASLLTPAVPCGRGRRRESRSTNTFGQQISGCLPHGPGQVSQASLTGLVKEKEGVNGLGRQCPG